MGELIARNLPLTRVPPGVQVQFRLTLDACTRLRELPENLTVGSLNCKVACRWKPCRKGWAHTS